eukprot:scaffold826_cov87-Skeletonema_dohrnii-CCMP3373.AAC.3
MAAEEEYYIFTGGVVPDDVTRVRIDKSITVIPADAFEGLPNIEELYCHIGVVRVEQFAFSDCPSLRLVIMPGVEVVEWGAFRNCEALTDVECGKLEVIGDSAFDGCESLTSINLPSIKIVEDYAFYSSKALTNVSFGKELESIGSTALYGCKSLERITIPLKNGMITEDDVFQGCGNLKHVDLVEKELHETIEALQMEEWRDFMNEEIASINQILSTTSAGTITYNGDVGGKAQAIKTWIRSVLHKIVYYKAEHHRYLNEAANTLQLALPSDIVIKNVLPFLELPSCTFEVGDHEEESDDSDDEDEEEDDEFSS